MSGELEQKDDDGGISSLSRLLDLNQHSRRRGALPLDSSVSTKQYTVRAVWIPVLNAFAKGIKDRHVESIDRG